ncbi:tRNA (N6-isopentenyl adenosine(37)-C2)-methylthiotransferase MiaB [Candidatus Frankia nodulisporulans]|uniref:tRNA (N6-isopentenyl adenosine(37)-C2)-methylthiotransferase MiaB n=1 Tax=Candidatus Frankia nodulisporulans TaxID=2060052 RepID=UPI0013D65030|nr:tRNA (N6-isopentenyl adenosine(37)-C2)-methylthiotransferase MiaB [Candidatus Frankia nodulisporulans]
MTGRSYEVRTFGCQMNVHDSERLAGLLESAGYVPAASGAEPDVVVFNTCAVRENADNRLYGNLGQLVPVKKGHPGMQIAVGGCLAQKDRATILRRAPWVDVVFGTHNLHRLPVLLERARHNATAQLEIAEALEVFPSTLPTRRASHHAAWVSISVGCDNTCTFCIVPSLRGVERDRRPGDVLAEVEALVAEGVLEITLLGQNVNSYGRSLGDPGAFAKLLRACGAVEGLERVRFTSPHPRDFTDDVIEAMATTPNVCHQLHMPLQSGSDAVLRRMRRSYRRDRYLGIISRVRAAMPDAAITTDIIVGFPGETEADFSDTLDVVREARFSGAFTFQYSPRPGTPAATMDEQVDRATVTERYARLVALQDEISWAHNRALVERRVELVVAEGEGRKDDATGRLSGRARDGRLVHFRAAELATGPLDERPRTIVARDIRPGDVVETVVTRGAPHHLTADGPVLAWRRTRAGDAWEQSNQATTPTAANRPAVSLGMPARRPDPTSPQPPSTAPLDAASSSTASADACCVGVPAAGPR